MRYYCLTSEASCRSHRKEQQQSLPLPHLWRSWSYSGVLPKVMGNKPLIEYILGSQKKAPRLPARQDRWVYLVAMTEKGQEKEPLVFLSLSDGMDEGSASRIEFYYTFIRTYTFISCWPQNRTKGPMGKLLPYVNNGHSVTFAVSRILPQTLSSRWLLTLENTLGGK